MGLSEQIERFRAADTVQRSSVYTKPRLLTENNMPEQEKDVKGVQNTRK